MSSPEQRGKPGVVSQLFPFTQYFADAPQPLFKPGASYDDDMEVCTLGVGGLAVAECVFRRALCVCCAVTGMKAFPSTFPTACVCHPSNTTYSSLHAPSIPVSPLKPPTPF